MVKLEKKYNKCSWDKTLRDCEFSNDIAGWQGGWQAKVCKIYAARSTVNIHLQWVYTVFLRLLKPKSEFKNAKDNMT